MSGNKKASAKVKGSIKKADFKSLVNFFKKNKQNNSILTGELHKLRRSKRRLMIEQGERSKHIKLFRYPIDGEDLFKALKKVVFLVVILASIVLPIFVRHNFLTKDNTAFVYYVLTGAKQEKLADYVTGTDEQMEVVNGYTERYRYSFTSDQTIFGIKPEDPARRVFWKVKDLEVSADPNAPDVVHYKCTLPGIVKSAYEYALAVNLGDDEEYSQGIPMEGDLRIVTDDDGNRRIDLGDGQNPVFIMAYVNSIRTDTRLSVNGIDYTVYSSAEAQYDALVEYATELLICYQTYALPSSDMIEFATETGEQLTEYTNNLSTIYNSHDKFRISKEGWRFSNGAFFKLLGMRRELWLIPLLLLCLAIIVTLLYALRRYIRYKQNLPYNTVNTELKNYEDEQKTAELVHAGLLRENEGYFTFKDLNDKLSECIDQFKRASAGLSLEHANNTRITFAKRFDELESGEETMSRISIAGWSLAALLADMLNRLAPDDIEKTDKLFHEIAEEYQKEGEALNNEAKCIQSLKALFDADASTATMTSEEFSSLFEAFIKKKNSFKDIMTRCAEKDCVPFSWMMKKIVDQNENTNRFIRQSIIMAFMPWLEKHKNSNEDIAKYYAAARAAVKQMVSGENGLSSFEVRVPEDYTPSQYAEIMNLVLKVIAPEVRFADMNALFDRAVVEIPGLMELLARYPLRLINPDVAKEGMYEFEPYTLILTTQFVPPENIGEVKRRFNQAFDMTVPNAAGVNVRLLTDEYGLIPVLYHEYQHFDGDLNEASVWFRSYYYSRLFYKRYKSADPAKDKAFVIMQNLIDKKYNSSAVDKINAMIKKYYGETLNLATAAGVAQSRIIALNRGIRGLNAQNKWYPEIKFPELGLEPSQDNLNYNIIKNSLVSHLTVPKTITLADIKANISDVNLELKTNRNSAKKK